MAFATSLKHLSLKLLPEPILRSLRKSHYAKKLAEAPDEPEMQVIPHLLDRGGHALDLGANFGKFTHFLARTVGPTGSVHAVEPVRGTFDVLRHNVRQFGLKNVTVHHAAISDRNALVTLAIPHYEQGGENLYEARIVSKEESGLMRTVNVAGRTLDIMFGHLGRIDFVKCDVEGHELCVLRGAKGILDVHRPAWMIEVSGNPDDVHSSAWDVVELMSRAGYRMYHLADVDTRRTANYFFLRPEHVRRLSNLLET